MDDMKICDTCEEKKPDTTEFFTKSKGIKPDGTPTTRSKCKKCANKAKTAKDKAKKNNVLPVDIKPIERIKSEELTEYQVSKKIEPVDTIEPIRLKKSNVPALTDDEILKFRTMINNQFVMTSDRTDRSQRKPRSYNMDLDIIQWLGKRAREEKCSTSDILNAIIHKVIN